MSRHDSNILIKSTLIITVTTSMIQWTEHRSQLNMSVLLGYVMICWVYGIFVISVDDVRSKRWVFVLHPVTQLALWLIGLIGIWLATEGWRVVEPLPAPWIIIGVAFTVASKEGWKWLWHQVAVRQKV